MLGAGYLDFFFGSGSDSGAKVAKNFLTWVRWSILRSLAQSSR